MRSKFSLYLLCFVVVPVHSVSPAHFVGVDSHGGVVIFGDPGLVVLVNAFLVVVSVCHKDVLVGAGVSFVSVFPEPVSCEFGSGNPIKPFLLEIKPRHCDWFFS